MVVSRSQLLEDGLTDAQIARFRRRSLLARTVTPGVYGVGQPPQTAGSRLMAATLSVTGSALHRRTAAKTLGFPMANALRSEPFELVTLFGRGSESPWAEVHRSRHLPAIDVTTVGPFPVTTVARTFCDLAAVIGEDRLRHLGERLLVDRMADLDDLLGCGGAVVRRGRPGSTRLRGVLASIDDGEPIPDSVLELLFIESVLLPYDLRLQRGFRPPWYDGIKGVTDFGSFEAQIIVETDGRRWHQISQDLERDRARDRQAHRHGFLPLRFTAAEVRREPEMVAHEIGHHLRARAA